jgi:hypothetical protein
MLIILASQGSFTSAQNLRSKNILGIVLLVGSIVYIGLRPVSGKYFTDMGTYARTFAQYQSGEPVRVDKDVYFEYFMKICSSMMDVNMFFLVCAFIFIYPMYVLSKKVFKEYWFYAFFMFVASFSFWGAAVNGIRNGMATSIFLLALAYANKRYVMAFLFYLAMSCHKSLLLPIAGYLATYLYNDPKKYFYFWLVCIPLSFAAGGAFESLFASLNIFEDDRMGYLTDDESFADNVGKTGFRLDFILYSASGVLAGWYFLIKRKFDDLFYQRIFNTFLLVNGFWILIIRAQFSNRFAYLSWFILGFLIIYPFLKLQFFKNQDFALKMTIFLYFAFTYFMYNLAYLL